jgi:hypothetical protein
MIVKKGQIRATLAAVLIALLCSGCSATLEYGEVIGMHIEPETQYLALMPIIVGKTTIIQQYWVYDDEDFVLTVRGYDEDGRSITEKWYVTKKEYKKIKLGEIIGYSKEYASREDEHKINQVLRITD